MADVGVTPIRVGSDEPRVKPKPADPCAMVLFGARGDLTKRLVVPALYNLATTGLLPKNFALIGVDHNDGDAQSWRDGLRKEMDSFVNNSSSEDDIPGIDDDTWNRLAASMSYVKGDLNDPAMYSALAPALAAAERDHGTRGNAIFYLAVGDRFFGPAVDGIGAAGLAKQDAGWRRVVIEKPFGHDLESARALDERILKVLREDQIYRIDHFLGKDTVQNIMALRFGNGIFEPLWNRDRIDHVQITVAETLGVEGRGKFYEATGALRDMVPNHVFSLLALLAMEPPTGFDSHAIRSKKADLYAAIPAIDPARAVRGQYAAGAVGGQPAVNYRDEPDVAADSNTETYVALEIQIDNWRWAGVPFFLRTGKHLCGRLTEIAICFKKAPLSPFQDTPVSSLAPNWLTLQIAPEEGVSLQFEARRPGPAVDLAAVSMDFRYGDRFKRMPNVGYETLLYDVMIGDSTLFMRADMVEQCWRVVQPVIDDWANAPSAIATYPSGSCGPEAADRLISRDGDRAWRPIEAPKRARS